MNVPINPNGRFGRVLLLALLLLAQGSALAHEINHLGYTDADTCIICAVHAGSDAIGNAAVPVLSLPEAMPFQAPAFTDEALCTRVSTHSPRAPPAVLINRI